MSEKKECEVCGSSDYREILVGTTIIAMTCKNCGRDTMKFIEPEVQDTKNLTTLQVARKKLLNQLMNIEFCASAFQLNKHPNAYQQIVYQVDTIDSVEFLNDVAAYIRYAYRENICDKVIVFNVYHDMMQANDKLMSPRTKGYANKELELKEDLQND